MGYQQDTGDDWAKLFRSNPFAKDDPAYDQWIGIMRLIQEKTFKVQADTGVIRQRHLPQAYDAPSENTILRIASPLAISLVLWATSFAVARTYWPAIAENIVGADIFYAASYNDLNKARALTSFNHEFLFTKWTRDAGSELGDTALHLASKRGNKAVVELLLSRGAEANAKGQRGETPLHRAAESGDDWGRTDVAKLLLEHGAKVNAVGDFGETPLHLAVTQGHSEIVQLLIANGADVNAKTTDGLTPMHMAAQGFRIDIVKLLRQHNGHE